MTRILFILVLAVEVFALANRGGGPLMSHLVLTAATFAVVVACVLFCAQMKFRWGAAEIAYALFFLFFVLSLVVSITPEFGLSEFLLLANTGILFIVFSSISFTERYIEWFLGGLIALGVIDTLIGYFIYTRTAFPRFAGTFLDLSQPYTSFGNDFANFLLLIIPLAVGWMARKHNRHTTTALTVIATSILLSGFLLSFSRGAWISGLCLTIAAAIWIIVNKKRAQPTTVLAHEYAPARKIIKRLAAIAILSLALVTGLQYIRGQVFPTTSFFQKATFQADEGNASTSERIEFWRAAPKMIQERPLFGSGVLSFKYLFPRYQKEFGINWDHPHDLFLKIGVENGAPAMIFFALFLLAIAWSSLKFLLKKPFHPRLFVLLGAFGALLHNLVDFNFIVGNFMIFMLFLALLRSSAPEPREPNGMAIRALAIFSFIILAFGIHEGLGNLDFNRGRRALSLNNVDTAITHLENAQMLFFKRDLNSYLALAYDKKYQTTREKTWLEQEKQILISNNDSVDAATVNRLGEIYFLEHEVKKAEGFFQTSISLDPQNRLKYYYNKIAALQAQRKNIDDYLKDKILTLLAEYKTALQENRHITVLTDNPQYAVLLYSELGMKKESEAMNNIRFQATLKFAAQYGVQSSTPLL